MPVGDPHAEAGQALGGLAARQVAAGDLDLVVEEHLGDAAHAGAADAHEVDPGEAGEMAKQGHRGPFLSASSSIWSAIAAAAPGRARARAARPIAASRAGSAISSRSTAASGSGVNSAAVSARAAPALSRARALST